MPEMLANSFTSHRLHKAVDWTVFTAGAIALVIAIGATFVSKTNLLNAELAPTEISAAQAI